MSGNQGRKPTGRVNYIWVVAAMYLLYLAYNLFSGLWEREVENPLLNVIGGVVFAVAAVLMILREWRAYQYGKAHIDDPETWSDEPAEAVGDAPAEDSAPEALPEDGDDQEARS